jgi:hypothetical protein
MFRELFRNFFELMFSNIANGLGKKRSTVPQEPRLTKKIGLPRNGIQSTVKIRTPCNRLLE